jgi:histone-binding protein RBBP4
MFQYQYKMFTYVFRDKVVDFHWNAFDPWTIVSVSDDCASTGGGGTLQVNKCFCYLLVRTFLFDQITLNFAKSYYTSFDLLQIWRMLDLIYRPEDEVLAELDKYKSYILGSDSDT